jgi:hypothetical protein
MLQRGDQFLGQTAVGDKNHSDHDFFNLKASFAVINPCD